MRQLPCFVSQHSSSLFFSTSICSIFHCWNNGRDKPMEALQYQFKKSQLPRKTEIKLFFFKKKVHTHIHRFSFFLDAYCGSSEKSICWLFSAGTYQSHNQYVYIFSATECNFSAVFCSSSTLGPARKYSSGGNLVLCDLHVKSTVKSLHSFQNSFQVIVEQLVYVLS